MLRPTNFDVLYEDNHLLALVKPAGLATMGTPSGVPTLLNLAREYIKHKYAKPGNVYLGVMSRLDGPVSGVVLLARTSKAAARLTEQFRTRSVEKTYWAVVQGVVEPTTGVCEDCIAQDSRSKRMRIVGPSVAEGKPSRLSYRRLAVLGQNSLLEIDLETGRKHQIRLQLSGRGYPVLGDFKYGGPSGFAPGIALHARRLVVTHPVRDERLELVAPLPPSWKRLGVREM